MVWLLDGARDRLERAALLRPPAPRPRSLAIDVDAVLGIGSVILVMLLGQSRVFYSMSRDGLLAPWAGKVHPLPHPLPLHDLHRHCGLPGHRDLAAAAARDLGQHRHAAGVHAGVRRRVDPQVQASRPAPPLPHALGSGRPNLGHPVLLRLDADAARRYVDPSGRVARDRTRDLLELRTETFETEERRLAKASRENVTRHRHATTSRNNVTQRRRTPSRDALARRLCATASCYALARRIL